ncbi:MAG: hypothetical protein ACLQU1_17615 [Bryobacteraceae bacterium]
MIFDPFKDGPSAVSGRDQKKRAFLVGNGEGRVHLLVKMALYRGQSINCYHLIREDRRKLEGRNTPGFDAIRDEYILHGIEVPYPNDIPESDVERWVGFGKREAKMRNLEVLE